MKSISTTLIGAALLTLGLAACNTSKKNVQIAGPVAVKNTVQTNAAVHKILYGEWLVYKVGKQTVTGSDRPDRKSVV